MSDTKAKRSVKSATVAKTPVVADSPAPVKSRKQKVEKVEAVASPAAVAGPVAVAVAIPAAVAGPVAAEPSPVKTGKRKAAAALAPPAAPAAPAASVAPVAPPATAKKGSKKTANKVVEAAAVAVAEVDGANDVKSETRKRYFRCIYLKDDKVVEGGCYCGKKPKQAGNKACTKVCNDLFTEKKAASQKVVFGMYEVRFKKTDANKGKARKLYVYEGERIKLDTPAEVPIHLVNVGGTDKHPKLDPVTKTQMVIKYNHYNKIKKYANTTSNTYTELTKWMALNMNTDRAAKLTVSPVKDVVEHAGPVETKQTKSRTKKQVVVEPAAVAVETAPETPKPVETKQTKTRTKKANVIEPVAVAVEAPVVEASVVEAPVVEKKTKKSKKSEVLTTVVLDAPAVKVTKAEAVVEPKKTRAKKV